MEAEKQRLVAQKFEQKARTGDVMINEKTNFAGLMLAPEVLEGLAGAGFKVPSPIQLQAIPLGRAGLDLIVQAKSGTGKTCVFTVIALESINTENSCMQVVILAPTREIAVQIWEVIKSIGRSMEKLRCYVFIGGLNINDDKLKLKKCHIAVATPGRFRQLIELDAANVNSVRLFVLDEADKLLEAGFQDDINWIYSALPTNKQMIAASATYPEYLAQQLTTYMRSPKMIRLNACDPALLGISQYYVLLPFSSHPYKVYEEKSEFLLKLLSSVDFQQCLVFSNYQSRAQSLSKLLDSKGWQSTYICGSQEQEKRLTAMAKLRQYQCRVLISTDLTSRGIDVENVNLVVNLDLPVDHETYLHRIGRAGRYGSFGAAVTLVTQGRESADLRIIEARCQTSIQLLPDPIPEGLTHSGAKVDMNVEVTVEEALQLNPSPDCVQVKMYQDTSDAEERKWTEQEFILNNTTGHEDHATGHEDDTSGHEDHTTGCGDPTTGHKDHTIGHEDHTTRHGNPTTGLEDPTTGLEDPTTGLEDPTTGPEDHTTGHVAVNGTLNVESLCTFNIQHEGKSNGSEGFALGTDMTQQECSNAFLSDKNGAAVNDTESGNAFCKNEVDALNENEIGSLKANDDNSNKSDVMPGNIVSDVTNGVDCDNMKINVDNSDKQLNVLDSPTTKIQPRGNRVQLNLDMITWCSFVKETLPVSEQILSLGELVSANRSYAAETNGAAEASESDSNPKRFAEDLAVPTDESVFEDIGQMIVRSDYSYATLYPCSAKLLGDLLEIDKMSIVSPDERRIILSSGDAALPNLSAEEHLPIIKTSVIQSGGDAFPQNLSGEECLPDKENQAAETIEEKEQTSDLQLVPKNVNISSGTTYQDVHTSRLVKWTREQLMRMEKLAHNVVIAPQVVKLVQELCIKRGCEYTTHDTWEYSKQGNARGRPGTKFGGRKPNYTSNRKEPLPRSNTVSNGAVEARSLIAPISSGSAAHSFTYSTMEAATPSLPPNDSVDAKHTVSSTSSYSTVDGIKASTLSVPTDDSNDTASTPVPPNDITDTAASLTSSTTTAEVSTRYLRADAVEFRRTATPSSSFLTVQSASPVITPVGCNDTRSTATWTSTLQKTSDLSSKTYSSQGYQVSEQVVENAEIKSPSIYLQSNQTMSTTVCHEPSYPCSGTWKPSQISDRPLMSTMPSSSEPNAGKSSTEPECSPVMLGSRPKYEKADVMLEESAGTILSWPACNELTCIPHTKEAVCENQFQEVPVTMCQMSSGKFSELPCDTTSASLLPPLKPLQEHIQVVDDNQSLGRDYMLKLSACKDVVESSSETSDIAESGFQDELYWKPSVKQTHKKSCAEKKKRTSTRAKDQAKQMQQTKEPRQSRRTMNVQNAASNEYDTSHINSTYEVHNRDRSRDDFFQKQPFQGWTGHKTHSHPDSASTRKVHDSHGRESANVGHSIPQQSFPGYANLDAYASYYWNSYMTHLHDAEYFRQLLTSLADQTRLQDIAVQQAAYIQHMIAFHRKL